MLSIIFILSLSLAADPLLDDSGLDGGSTSQEAEAFVKSRTSIMVLGSIENGKKRCQYALKSGMGDIYAASTFFACDDKSHSEYQKRANFLSEKLKAGVIGIPREVAALQSKALTTEVTFSPNFSFQAIGSLAPESCNPVKLSAQETEKRENAYKPAVDKADREIQDLENEIKKLKADFEWHSSQTEPHQENQIPDWVLFVGKKKWEPNIKVRTQLAEKARTEIRAAQENLQKRVEARTRLVHGFSQNGDIEQKRAFFKKAGCLGHFPLDPSEQKKLSPKTPSGTTVDRVAD